MGVRPEKVSAFLMAEGMGFEPALGLPLSLISSRAKIS
jgi:hypothetical protein